MSILSVKALAATASGISSTTIAATEERSVTLVGAATLDGAGDALDGAIGLEGGSVAAAPAAFYEGLVHGAALPAPFAVFFLQPLLC